ncbi:PhzF family phenazine biosynthesis protein [Altericroceibacterium spongiae]|uniref:PhzF family phenazine biosynthesis protein n=1 Tax=Altericroceibacterium spongiae TaxID=2320269 RepID=A0A420EEK3_9SPHN|nr:PhzF family phenazine biosynthesis protein [Altericroceibacterium spongiae]RKF19100.1 PhzF family phenazine biosynthesis protein [Altericroceibacterium spongiae]
MTPIPYWHVDAFANRLFAGNQAAVMILDAWLPDTVLQAIAAENNFAETAFLVKDASGETDWELRWFTPEFEIRLCGHATLASGHILCALDPEKEELRFRTRKAGILTFRRGEAGLYEIGLPVIATQPDEWAEAAGLLGGAVQGVWSNPDLYTIFLFGSEAEIRALRPDFQKLARLGAHQFICTAPGEAYDVVSRVFVPGGGIDEDSVTGSAHAALTPFWAHRLGRDSFTAHQASARGGDLTCRLDGDTVWLGGPCVTVVDGRFYIPEE